MDGRVLWANLHLLWLSLVPFVAARMGENHFSQWSAAACGVVMLAAGVACFILAQALVRLHCGDSVLATALGRDVKGGLYVLVA